ncbi:MAG: hypothetical protein D6739_08085 [Nitrospirae bacterium]|nr:MAG: hypothetical protein D6739_08085 [Nitrospirota bacterium]
MGRTLLAILVLLLAVGPAAAQVRTASLPPTTAVAPGGSRVHETGVARALARAMKDDLLDTGLVAACRHYRLPAVWRRLAGATTAPERPARRLACHLAADLLDLAVGLDLRHRGWGASVEVDLDDRLVAVEAAGRRLRYGLSYEPDRDAVQALLRLPF